MGLNLGAGDNQNRGNLWKTLKEYGKRYDQDFLSAIRRGTPWTQLGREPQAYFLGDLLKRGYFTHGPSVLDGDPGLKAYAATALAQLRAGHYA
jgi:hypothetical protein